MPTVIFSHTKTQEKEYLADLLKEKWWFERRQFPVFLPQDTTAIEKEVSKKDERLQRKTVQLQKAWRTIEAEYFQIVKKFRHKKLLSKYKCHTSRFGPEGECRRPNLLLVRLRTQRDKKRILETIGHELLHLFFIDFSKSKRLTYAEREGMVDSLILETDLAKLFPKYERQSIGKVRRNLLESILQ